MKDTGYGKVKKTRQFWTPKKGMHDQIYDAS